MNIQKRITVAAQLGAVEYVRSQCDLHNLEDNSFLIGKAIFYNFFNEVERHGRDVFDGSETDSFMCDEFKDFAEGEDGISPWLQFVRLLLGNQDSGKSAYADFDVFHVLGVLPIRERLVSVHKKNHAVFNPALESYIQNGLSLVLHPSTLEYVCDNYQKYFDYFRPFIGFLSPPNVFKLMSNVIYVWAEQRSYYALYNPRKNELIEQNVPKYVEMLLFAKEIFNNDDELTSIIYKHFIEHIYVYERLISEAGLPAFVEKTDTKDVSFETAKNEALRAVIECLHKQSFSEKDVQGIMENAHIVTQEEIADIIFNGFQGQALEEMTLVVNTLIKSPILGAEEVINALSVMVHANLDEMVKHGNYREFLVYQNINPSFFNNDHDLIKTIKQIYS